MAFWGDLGIGLGNGFGEIVSKLRQVSFYVLLCSNNIVELVIVKRMIILYDNGM